MKMEVIIDRFENTMAVCEKEDRSMINIQRSRLPPQVREGDVIRITGEIYEIDFKETEERKKRMQELMKDIRRKGL
jgi:hypothetical protein